MKAIQRRVGKIGKRSDNEADVQTVLNEFKAVDHMLDFMIKELKAWRNGWDDILKKQYDISEAFAELYKPIEPTTDPEMRHQPAQTPAAYMEKCLGLQREYSDMKTDLGQELAMIDKKLIRPMEEAKKSTKMLHKTLKHRENMKLDYERYMGRADHVRKKDIRSQKEEAALAAHESNLTQAQIDYQTADEQVKQTFPQVSEAVMNLLPAILANMVMLQTTLVGQLFTVIDGYTRKYGLPNPAPSDTEVIAVWDSEFSSFRKELESGLSMIANGRVMNISMNIHENTREKTSTTGFNIRHNVLQRDKLDAIPVRPATSSTFNPSSESNISSPPEEVAPPKPPRPGGAPSPGSFPTSSSPGPYPGSFPGSMKPRMPSSSSFSSNPSNGFTPAPPSYSSSASPKQLPYPDNASNTNTPPSRYLTPVNGNGPLTQMPVSPVPAASNSGGTDDYFSSTVPRRPSQASSITSSSAASSAAAAKKKPPPPVPAKRIPSTPAPQYVTALYDFEGQNPGDLAFREGDRIKVVKKTGSTDDWWQGELNGNVGAFPANYVSL